MWNFFMVFCLSLLTISGCYNKPVRHLASDASMIVPMKSTRQDVLLYLGEPDGYRNVSPDVEEFVYYEDKRSTLTRTPILNLITDPEGYEMIIVTLSGDVVTSCEFRVFNEDDLDKINSYTWDEVK